MTERLARFCSSRPRTRFRLPIPARLARNSILESTGSRLLKRVNGRNIILSAQKSLHGTSKNTGLNFQVSDVGEHSEYQQVGSCQTNTITTPCFSPRNNNPKKRRNIHFQCSQINVAEGVVSTAATNLLCSINEIDTLWIRVCFGGGRVGVLCCSSFFMCLLLLQLVCSAGVRLTGVFIL